MELFSYDSIGQTVNFKNTLVNREFKDVELREWWPLRSHKAKIATDDFYNLEDI